MTALKTIATTNNDVSFHDNAVYSALEVEYREMAPWYDRFWAGYLDRTLVLPLQRLNQQLTATTVNTIISTPTSSSQQYRPVVADVGCGTGVFLKRFVDEYDDSDEKRDHNIQSPPPPPPKLIGIEPSRAMMEQAKAKFVNIKSSITDISIEWYLASAESIPLPDHSVDIVTSTSAFHFFQQSVTALHEMKRILHPTNGHLIITDWCADYFIVRLYHNVIERFRWRKFIDGYPRPLTCEELVQLVQQAGGFHNVSCQRYTVRFWGVIWWGMQTLTATTGER